ncbi:hypothetical protein Q1695_011628 [Nippostrongylus brasiliensis]|nr:hypothetical protein Q1695_011628 [Nippostrongylus brasiliensis]
MALGLFVYNLVQYTTKKLDIIVWGSRAPSSHTVHDKEANTLVGAAPVKNDGEYTARSDVPDFKCSSVPSFRQHNVSAANFVAFTQSVFRSILPFYRPFVLGYENPSSEHVFRVGRFFRQCWFPVEAPQLFHWFSRRPR